MGGHLCPNQSWPLVVRHQPADASHAWRSIGRACRSSVFSTCPRLPSLGTALHASHACGSICPHVPVSLARHAPLGPPRAPPSGPLSSDPGPLRPVSCWPIAYPGQQPPPNAQPLRGLSPRPASRTLVLSHAIRPADAGVRVAVGRGVGTAEPFPAHVGAVRPRVFARVDWVMRTGRAGPALLTSGSSAACCWRVPRVSALRPASAGGSGSQRELGASG